MKLALLLTLGLLFTHCLCDVNIETFLGPPFSVKPPSGMYQLDGIGLDNLPAGTQISCYGDFNNDKFTDFVSLSDNLKTLTVYVYSHENFTFWEYAQISVTGDTITSIIPGDYNYDGWLDLMVVSLNPDNTKTDLNFYFQNQPAKFGKGGNAPDLTDSINSIVQPFLLDIDGDRRMEFMFVEDGRRKVRWIGSSTPFTEKDFRDYMDSDPTCNGDKVLTNEFANPHSNGFVDFNGDCAADLFITSRDATNALVFEIWLRKASNGKFCLVDSPTITNTISLVSFADMNNDGRIDLVYAGLPTDASHTMPLHIIYNQFQANYKEPCKLQDASMKSPFTADSYNSETSIAGKSQVTPIVVPGMQNARLNQAPTSTSYPKIRIGDINIDGYPDLLFVVSTGGNVKSGRILLGINDAGIIKFDNSTLDTPDDKAYYSILLENKIISPARKQLVDYNVITASFFDFDEIGHLGIWAVTAEEGKPSQAVGFFNFVNTENFILKTLGLNGYYKNDDIINSLGGIYYGPSVECVLTDIDGNPRLAKSTQLAQSAYIPLDLPYMFMGLGRTNNYIENFIMGIPLANGEHDVQSTTWTPIIPNSQLIVNPRKGEAWTLDVYVNPTSETLYVVLTTLAILLILGAIIIHLHRKEKEEDEKNRDVLLHIFG